MHSFSDFAKEVPFTGTKVDIADLFGKDIFIYSFYSRPSKHRRNDSYLTVSFSFEEDGERHIFFTASKVLEEQLSIYKDKLPFKSKIEKVGECYSLT